MDYPANVNFCRLCDAFLTGKDGNSASVAELDSIAKDLALDENVRVQMGTDNPSIWPSLHQAWDTLARHVAFDEDDPTTRCLITSFARFTRNLVAAVPSNQQNAFTSEPSLRRILYVHTSWTATQDPQSYPVTRMLVQTLSNMVTLNDDLTTRLWETYLNLPEEQAVLIRLLGSPDTRTILSSLVFLINCVHQSNRRRYATFGVTLLAVSLKGEKKRELLAETQVGARLCIALLDRMVTLYEAEEPSDEVKVFDYMYNIFAHLFDGGFAPRLYANLKVPGEIIAPHQTTLLKLLDSYLHSSPATAALVGMCPMLTTCFFEFCTFSVRAIRGSMDNVADICASLPTHGAIDPFLPKVCEALILVTQCLINAMLEFEGNHIGNHSKDELLPLLRGTISPHGQDIAACTVELLWFLDAFLPRINFGKPMPSSKAIPLGSSDSTGFSYIKRDLVRLLGVLCYKDKKIQDSIRNCGGIPVIMNMCVVDERNPYLREHAIFTLHNLLEDNEENQKVVNDIQPSEGWDQDGMLRK